MKFLYIKNKERGRSGDGSRKLYISNRNPSPCLSHKGQCHIELRGDVSISGKSPKGLHRKAQGNALGKRTIISLSSERA